jgi:hypothetical protein
VRSSSWVGGGRPAYACAAGPRVSGRPATPAPSRWLEQERFSLPGFASISGPGRQPGSVSSWTRQWIVVFRALLLDLLGSSRRLVTALVMGTNTSSYQPSAVSAVSSACAESSGAVAGTNGRCESRAIWDSSRLWSQRVSGAAGRAIVTRSKSQEAVLQTGESRRAAATEPNDSCELEGRFRYTPLGLRYAQAVEMTAVRPTRERGANL